MVACLPTACFLHMRAIHHINMDTYGLFELYNAINVLYTRTYMDYHDPFWDPSPTLIMLTVKIDRKVPPLLATTWLCVLGAYGKFCGLVFIATVAVEDRLLKDTSIAQGSLRQGLSSEVP